MRSSRLARCLLLSLLAGRVATADDSLDARRAEAKQLKDAGAAALERGELAEALRQFRAAYERFPSARLQYNIGVVAERMGRPSEALAAYEVFLASDAEAPAEARSRARASCAELETKVAQLEIAEASAGEVLVDGRVIGRGPGTLRVRVDPGRHVVRVVESARRAREESVTVDPGARVRVTPRLLVPELAVADGARVPVYRRWWLWTSVAAVAAVALGVGLGVGLTAGPDRPGAPLPPIQ